MDSATHFEPFTVWLTGPSGVGKTTLAKQLQLHVPAATIDGDELRKSSEHLPQGAHPFSLEARTANVLYAARLAKNAMARGQCAIVALISPDRDPREQAMRMLEHRSLVVYLKCPWHELQRRDSKGIYHKGLNRQISNVCGLDFAYQVPMAYENALVIDTFDSCPVCSARRVVRTLQNRGWLKAP